MSNDNENATIAKKWPASYWATGLTAVLGGLLLRDAPWLGSVYLHTVMKSLATLLALTVGAMALVRHYTKPDSKFLLIGTGFLGTAFLDGYHAVVTSEQFAHLLPSELSSLIPWSWIASRVFLSALLCLSWLAWRRDSALSEHSRIPDGAIYLATAALTTVSFLFFAFVPLPRAYYPELVFHRPEEFVPALLFLIALVGYWRKGDWRRDPFERWLVLALIVSVMGQTVFMSFSGQLFDLQFDAAHMLKKVSYLCVLGGLLANMHLTFHMAEDRADALEESNQALAREVAERSRAEAEIKALTAEQELLLNSTPLGIAFVKDRTAVRTNRAFETLFGWTPDSLHEMSPGDIYADQRDFDRVGEETIGAFDRGEPFELEAQLQHRDGSTFWGRIVGRVLDPNDHDKGSIWVAEDITERRLNDEIIEHSKRLLEAVSNDQIDLIARFRPDGTVIYTNLALAAEFNRKPEECVGLNIGGLLRGKEWKAVQAALASLSPEHPVVETERRAEWPAGTVRWFLWRSRGFFDADGNLIEVQAVGGDITSRVRTENKLRASEERIQAVLDNVLDGIITIDETGIIQSANKASERVFGYAEGELVGHNVRILMPEPYHSAHDGYLHNYLDTGVANIIGRQREVEGKRRNGEIFPLDLAVNELRLGDQRMFVGITRDISDRKAVEKLKDEFMSTMSHELRTPLTSIRGALGLALGGALGEFPEQARDMLDIAERNSERLVELVNDILDIEKIESGGMEFRSDKLDMADLIPEAIKANKTYGEKYSVEFEFAEPPSEAFVTGDALRLNQVMANLLSNAAKFSPPKDTVKIYVNLRDDNIRVAVADNGPGIPREFHDKLFERFTQADSSDSRQESGTGLGLSISKAIIERLGGSIAFETRVGKGTTFFFDLPRWSGEDSRERQAIRAESVKGQTITAAQEIAQS